MELCHAYSLRRLWELHTQSMNFNQSKRLRRCGGSFIKRGGQLYRVAQDCNGFYGKRLFMVPVLVISPTEYQEDEAKLLWDKSMPPYGYCHTYNEIEVDSKRLSVIDVHCDEMKSLNNIVGDIAKAAKKMF